VVEYRDFSSIPADRTFFLGQITIDGQPVPGADKVPAELGILSPQVSHFWHRPIPKESLGSILEGKVRLAVAIKVSYGDAEGSDFCYRMKFDYYPLVRDFTPSGGSDRCSAVGP
jgi:hypothetical protein